MESDESVYMFRTNLQHQTLSSAGCVRCSSTRHFPQLCHSVSQQLCSLKRILLINQFGLVHSTTISLSGSPLTTISFPKLNFLILSSRDCLSSQLSKSFPYLNSVVCCLPRLCPHCFVTVRYRKMLRGADHDVQCIFFTLTQFSLFKFM